TSPVYPRKPTCERTSLFDVKCHKRTYAPQSLCGGVLIECARTEPAHRAAERGYWLFGNFHSHRKSLQSQRLAHALCVWRFLLDLGHYDQCQSVLFIALVTCDTFTLLVSKLQFIEIVISAIWSELNDRKVSGVISLVPSASTMAL